MTSDIYVETTADGVVLDWNARAEHLLGWSRVEALGHRFDDLVVATEDEPELGALRTVLVAESYANGARRAVHERRIEGLTLRHRDGRLLTVDALTWTVRRHEGVTWRCFAHDVTDRRANEEALANAYLHDPLTGLPSRTMFAYHLSYALARQRDNCGAVAVVLLDLDRFQAINDGLGHDVGDEVLVEIAGRLAGLGRERDVVARFGGDEFLVLVEGDDAKAAAGATAERIAEALSAPIETCAAQVYVSCSIGIAVSGQSGDDAASLISNADAAMYRSKRSGGARHEVFRESMRASALERMHTESSLHRAVARDELRVFYQPIVAVRSRRVVGAEALIRWQHPERGLVLPVEFIRSAEETGLIAGIDTWVLEQACQQFMEWRSRRAELGRTGGISIVEVNLSARQVSDPKVIDTVRGVLAHSGLDPSCLAIEITESALMDDPEGALTTLRQLKNLGVRLAVDDFGTGFSSLSYLKRFPLDVLKIDKSFIEDLVTSAEASVIVAAVVNLAHTLGLAVVAEGVETPNQLSALESLGCDHYQGFLFAAAIPADDFTRQVIGAPSA